MHDSSITAETWHLQKGLHQAWFNSSSLMDERRARWNHSCGSGSVSHAIANATLSSVLFSAAVSTCCLSEVITGIHCSARRLACRLPSGPVCQFRLQIQQVLRCYAGVGMAMRCQGLK